MDTDTLRQATEHAGLLAVGLGFLAGFVFSFNPIALASIPVSLAYVTKARDTRQSIVFSVAFIAAMIIVQVILGIIAGFGGSWAADVLGRAWALLLGPVLIVLGFLWVGWIRLPLPALRLRATRANTAWGAFALGAVFTVAICPICTPALVILLGVTCPVSSDHGFVESARHTGLTARPVD